MPILIALGSPASLCAQPVAVIAALEGTATVENAQHHSQPAHSFDWLLTGTVLEVSPGARLVLAFANGWRYEIGSGAKVSVNSDGPGKISGAIRPLEKLPPMPKLPVITLEARTGTMGGIRVREMGAVRLLFPRTKLSTLPDHTVLRFELGEGGAASGVEVSDEAGRVLYHSETADTTVNVPGGALGPGQFYVWRVKGTGGQVLGQTTFTTVSAETITSRATFKASIPESDADGLVLLAAVDAQLGLFDEASNELRAALPHSAHSDPIRKLLSIIEDAMH
jgi:hypothetical protein